MKKIYTFILTVSIAGIVFAQPPKAEEPDVKTPKTEKSDAVKPKLEPYGFIKGDMIYSTNSVEVFGASTIVSPAIPTGAEDKEEPFLSFTAQHSRVGLKGSGGIGKVNVGGIVEIDFFSNTNDANTKPRLRQAYTWCEPANGLSIKIGQQWDIFSPLNPTTNNTNANIWYSGNYGFRRSQIRVAYIIPVERVKPGIDLCVAEGAKDTEPGPGIDNLAEVPQFQGRIFLGFLQNIDFGISGLFGSYHNERKLKTWGFAVDLNLPFHEYFALKGEYGMGANLNNANFFSIAGNGSIDDERESMGFWFNAISKPSAYFNIVLGLGMENNTTEDLADGLLESNMAFYTDLIFPIGKFFSLTFEYENLNAQYKGEDEKRKAHIIDLAGKVVF